MPGDGLAHGPPARKKQAAVTTGPARSSGIPCATVLTLISRSPWGPGFLAPITREIIILRAWHQRRDARTTRLRRPHRPRSSGATNTSIASRLACRDDRETPLLSRWDSGTILLICRSGKAKYFPQKSLT